MAQELISRDVVAIPQYQGKDPTGGELKQYLAMAMREYEKMLRDHYEDLKALFNSGGNGTVRRAMVKTVDTASFTAKLLDAFEVEEAGNSITVYPHQHYGSNALTGNVWRAPVAGKKVAVFRDLNGIWYIAYPIDDSEQC